MSPIDDELRSLFTSRADLLAPAPDPLAGIESRARRMRRNRVAASVAGTALAVAAIAAVVPAVLPEKVAKGGGSQFADTTPTPSAPDRVVFATAALDPANPWSFRGDASLLSGDNLRSLQAEWAAANHPGSTLTPLFGQRYESSGQVEIVFTSSAKGVHTWGVATSSEAGWEFGFQRTYQAGVPVLMAALSGDEVGRLLVLASPEVGDLSYAPDGKSFRTGDDARFPGVAFFPLEGDTSKDVVRLLDGNGDLDKPLFLGAAPDLEATGESVVNPPDNLVSWPARGATPKPDFLEAATVAYAQAVGAKRGDVQAKVLFAGDDDARNRYVFGQAWIKGSDAHTFGYSVNGKGEATPFLGPVTDKSPAVLAFVVAAGTGQSRDMLVVVPEPAAATTYYGAAQSEYIEITGQDYLKGVRLIDRFPNEQGNDMLKLVDAQGRKLFEGKVGPLLCGVKSCG